MDWLSVLISVCATCYDISTDPPLVYHPFFVFETSIVFWYLIWRSWRSASHWPSVVELRASQQSCSALPHRRSSFTLPFCCGAEGLTTIVFSLASQEIQLRLGLFMFSLASLEILEIQLRVGCR